MILRSTKHLIAALKPKNHCNKLVLVQLDFYGGDVCYHFFLTSILHFKFVLNV